MTWNLIKLPADDELVMGYIPSISFEADRTRVSEGGEIRRYLVSLFVVFGILAGLQNAFLDHPADGQRRLAEVNLSERKAECRDCPVLFANTGSASHGS